MLPTALPTLTEIANPSIPSRAGYIACLIYCRVSSRKQLTEGDGLRGQEKRLRDFATMKGYHVMAVFTDGITGGTSSRRGMEELLAFLAEWNKAGKGPIVVLIDDIK